MFISTDSCPVVELEGSLQTKKKIKINTTERPGYWAECQMSPVEGAKHPMSSGHYSPNSAVHSARGQLESVRGAPRGQRSARP